MQHPGVCHALALFEKSPEKLFEKVKETVVNLKAEIVAVGLPKNMDGSEGESAQNARAFAERLHNETGLQVDLQDERGIQEAKKEKMW